MSFVPLSPMILRTSSAFCEIRTVEALRGRGSFAISSSSSADEPEVSEGTRDFGEGLSTEGSSGMQWDVVVVRMVIEGRDMGAALEIAEEELRDKRRRNVQHSKDANAMRKVPDLSRKLGV
jgi:hypothetical protein